MRFRVCLTSGLLAFATLVAGSMMALLTVNLAQAAIPPFDPAGNGATQGGLSLYDEDGNLVTSGPLSETPFYALAKTDTGRAGDTKATLYAATPNEGADPYTWSNEKITPSRDYPDPDAPGVLKNNSHALTNGIARWFDPSDPASYASTNPNTNTTASWQNLYQLRLITSGPGQAADTQRYSSATIKVDAGAGTWEQVFPDPNASPPGVTKDAVVNGKARVGYTVSCDAKFTDATGTKYKWFRADKAIAKETKQKYKLVAADYNTKVKCRAIASNANGNTQSNSKAVKIGLGDALVAKTKPTLTGNAKPNKVLTAKPGAWNPKAASYKFQWFRGGKAISGATSKKYTVKSGDVGKKILCQVTAKKKGYANGVKKTPAKTVTK